MLALLGLFMTSLVYGQSTTAPADSDFFPFAVWYSGGKARATMLSDITPESKEAWKHDLQEIKSLGFNTVKTWVEWAHCEPREGEFHFENLKLLLDLSKEIGLKVLIQVYAESAPEWVGKKYPDVLFEAQNGYRIKSQVDPGYCVDNRPVREAMMKFYEEAAKIAVRYPNFFGWDVWSEPHIVQWGRPNWINNASYCYCPASQELFRQWLKKKYGGLEQLNKAWYRTFVNWDDVEAPKFGTILSYTDFIDWREFNAQKMAWDLRMRYDALRTVDKSHVVSSHASPVSLFSSPYGSAENDFLMSAQVDYYGLSQYPKHNLPGDWKPWRFMTSADFSYSANRKNGGYYVGEFQAGYGTVGLNVGDPVTPADQRIWAWTSLATGAKGIFAYAYYPMSSGYESGGYGLINLDGSITERAVALGKLAKFVGDHASLFSESKPVKPEIALVYSPLAQMVGGSRNTGASGHTSSLVGYYRFFKDHNIPVDFIYLDELNKDDLSQYKLIILPYSLMFTQTAADTLSGYVRQGGHLMAEARLAWNDSRGYASLQIPGMGFSDVFGVKEREVKTLRDEPVPLVVENTTHPATRHLVQGDTIRGAYFAESLTVLDSAHTDILARFPDGTPSIVAARYGKGQSMFVGSFLYLNDTRGSLWDQSTEDFIAQDSINRHNNAFLLGVVDWAGVTLPVTSSLKSRPNNPMVLRLQKNPSGHLLYILNQGTALQKAFQVQVPVSDNGTYKLTELLSQRSMEIAVKNKQIEFTTSDIEGKDAEIWTIVRQ
jgi:beta-galactosidase